MRLLRRTVNHLSDLKMCAVIGRETHGLEAAMAMLAFPDLEIQAAIESITRTVTAGLAALADDQPPTG